MWLQVGNIALGIWLLAAPAVLPATKPGAAVDRVVGPIVIWLGVLALRSVTRPFRALNVLCGMALTIVPWLVHNTGPLILSATLTGWVIIILSIPRGRVPQRTAGGWWAILQPELLNHASDD